MYHGKEQCRDSYAALLKKMAEYGEVRAALPPISTTQADHEKTLKLENKMAKLSKQTDALTADYEQCNRNKF